LKPSVIILAYNSELSIGETIASILPLTDDIHIVDSFSKDRTVEIARALGAQVTEHAFESYGAQRNWAIDHCPVRYAWQLHLDADERVTPELLAEIEALPEDARETGFILPRLMTFLGHPIRHGGLYPTWHMRLFKNGLGRCEMRKYDQHFYVLAGTTRQLTHDMIDDIRMPLSEWTSQGTSSSASVHSVSDITMRPSLCVRFCCSSTGISSSWVSSMAPRDSSSTYCRPSGSVF
jgi:glycosyltransferase involved in cell wall biosynthesis